VKVVVAGALFQCLSYPLVFMERGKWAFANTWKISSRAKIF